MASLQVLSPILLPADLYSIFGRVAALFSKNLAEAFSRLEPRVSATCHLVLDKLTGTTEKNASTLTAAVMPYWSPPGAASTYVLIHIYTNWHKCM